MIRFGPQTCGDLDAAASREWLVADGLGGYAMGTVAGLRTRRYHGLLMVSGRLGASRRLGLAALDPLVIAGDRRVRLATHEWGGGVIDPRGHVHLSSFTLEDGVPRWRFSLGDIVIEREIAMLHGRPAVAITHQLLSASRPVRLELAALCTWRDAHGERTASGAPRVEPAGDGFVFEEAYRVLGPGFAAGGEWYRDVRYRVEAERGLTDHEDLWYAGSFAADLAPGQCLSVTAWADIFGAPPPPAKQVVAAARTRARSLVENGEATAEEDALLTLAADQHITSGPSVVAGYPWFGEWSRDTMTSYEGLFLETGRVAEGRALLLRAATTLSEGMLPNTVDFGGGEYNTADATLWFLHAVGRHVDVTMDVDLAAELADALSDVVRHHLAGARFGIRVDPADGLLTQGEAGYALTWMDARVEGRPVTQRAGKAVELNALWINGIATVASLLERIGRDASGLRAAEQLARTSFGRRFLVDRRCLDVVDGPGGDSREVRPNCLLACSLPRAPLRGRDLVEVASGSLLTSLGLRSLSPDDPAYVGRHRGGPSERDRAYHQGTVWPWLAGPYVEATIASGLDPTAALDGLTAHLSEWGLGSVSETADGDGPHGATGCPFQAWSVAELLRARALVRRFERERARA